MGHKLLLADDSITIQKVVKIIFSGDAYDLTIVDNGIDALDRARESVPDVMLIDAVMPGKNGYDVCREAKNDPRLSLVPILLLTGVFEPFDEAKSRESGADDFIAKPFESQVLIDKIEGLISLVALRRAAAPPLPVPLPPVAEPLPAVADEPQVDEIPFEVFLQEEEPLLIEEVTSLDDLWGMAAVEEEHEELSSCETIAVEEEHEELSLGETIAVEEEHEELSLGEVIAVEEDVAPECIPEPAEFDLLVVDELPPVQSESSPSPILPEPDDLMVEEFSFEEDSDEIPAFADELAEESEPEKLVESPEPEVVSFPEEPREEDLLSSGEASIEELPEPVELSAVQPPQEAVVAPQEGATLNEEQLVAALAKVSREVIERIVWEVVPDLAEALIKEEIRKIREGV